MRVIGVLDLRGGRAVHARSGQREGYQAVQAIGGMRISPGDAIALARACVDRLGITDLYAADLDAILSRLRAWQDPSASSADPPGDHSGGGTAGASQDALIGALVALGLPLWLDAGVTSLGQAQHAIHLGAAHVVVGLETLPSYHVLEETCAVVGGERVAFSLDLRNGAPLVAPGFPPDDPPAAVAARAAAAGARTIIVLDLARVGTGAGLDLSLIARVRRAVPAATLLAGGGVRGVEDLVRLAEAGCDGALVATALHDGRLGPGGVAAAKVRQPSATR